MGYIETHARTAMTDDTEPPSLHPDRSPRIDFDTLICPNDPADPDEFVVDEPGDEIHDITKGFDIQLRDGHAVAVAVVACSCGFRDETVLD